jgi:hypothetical protein
MTLQSRKHLTAWLGLIAMWLIVLVPIVSQLVVAARADDSAVALCSALHAPSDTARVSHGDPLAACGYCDLLADHVAMPTLPPSPMPFVMLVAIAAVAVLSTRFTPLGAFPSGRPRAPPAPPLLRTACK